MLLAIKLSLVIVLVIDVRLVICYAVRLVMTVIFPVGVISVLPLVSTVDLERMRIKNC